MHVFQDPAVVNLAVHALWGALFGAAFFGTRFLSVSTVPGAVLSIFSYGAGMIFVGRITGPNFDLHTLGEREISWALGCVCVMAGANLRSHIWEAIVKHYIARIHS